MWLPPFEILSLSVQTYAYDHYGTGQTRVPTHFVTFEHQVELLRRILSRYTNAERVILAAESSMSTVTIEVACRWPRSVSGVALVFGGLDFAPTEQVEQFAKGLRLAFEPTVRRFVRMAIPEDTNGRFQDALYDIIARTGGERAAALVESFFPVDVRHRVGDITTPTVVIHGELDTLPTSPLAAAEEMAGLIPGAHLIVIPGAGHVPTLARPEAVVEGINQPLG